MVKIKKKETDTVANIVQSISYGTGLICAKVSNLGKVTKTKEWKDVASKTQSIVKNVERSVTDSIADLKESFDEGVKSIVQEGQEQKASKAKAKKKEEVDNEEAEIVTEEKEISVEKQEISLQEEKIAVQKEEVVFKEEEIAGQKEEVAVEKQEIIAQEKKEAELSPLPSELAPVHGEEIEGELMEEDAPKKKVASSKTKKDHEVKSDPSEFTIGEFKKDGKDPKGLMGSIRKNKPEISLGSTDPLEWLNELLASGEDGQPLKYDIKKTPEIKEAKEAFENASEAEKAHALIKLNRLILEQAYPLKCPKIQTGEAPKKTEKPKADKTKSKRSKGSDSGLNLN